MVHVFFRNGNTVSVDNATEVRGDSFAVSEPSENRSVPGIACHDADGKVVACFQAEEIVGWSVD
jgi:hypothetical protein